MFEARGQGPASMCGMWQPGHACQFWVAKRSRLGHAAVTAGLPPFKGYSCALTLISPSHGLDTTAVLALLSRDRL